MYLQLMTESLPGSKRARIDSPASQPRLFIKQVKLENFKSFGGHQVIGPFHKSFNAVVGPNGTGKSNILDALLFVFGKRSNNIRLPNLSRVIHNAAVAGERSVAAKVEVTFKETIETGHGQVEYGGLDLMLKKL